MHTDVSAKTKQKQNVCIGTRKTGNNNDNGTSTYNKTSKLAAMYAWMLLSSVYEKESARVVVLLAFASLIHYIFLIYIFTISTHCRCCRELLLSISVCMCCVCVMCVCCLSECRVYRSIWRYVLFHSIINFRFVFFFSFSSLLSLRLCRSSLIALRF